MEYRIFDKKEACAWRGIAAVGVMLGHLIPASAPFFVRFFMAGNLWVGLFFFFTGYGLTISLSLKNDYLKHFLFRKALTVYVPFMIAELAYCLVYMVVGLHMDFKTVILSILGLKLANSVLWYVIEILIVYILFWLLNIMHIKYQLICWGFFYIIFELLAVSFDIGNWWYISTSCLLLGFYIKPFMNILNKINRWEYAIYVSFVILFSLEKCLGYYCSDIIFFMPIGYVITGLDMLLAPLFVTCIIFASKRVKLTTRRVLLLLGTCSYEIYLYHSVFGRVMGLWLNKIWLILATIIVTIVGAWLIRNLYEKIMAWILSKGANGIGK